MSAIAFKFYYRAALKIGESDDARSFLNAEVYNYISENRLYVEPEAACG